MFDVLVFPERAAQRDEWILRRRPQRNAVTAEAPYACFVEEECGADGQVERVATIFLTNCECPFRCTMCDLWRNTLTESVPAGAIPRQIDIALSRLGPARSVKLYNSGSFFDPRAIPPEDYQTIAARLRGFSRVIVECHPSFVKERCVTFHDLLTGQLEVALGLETVHPEVLQKLNKRMTLDQFAAAASFLRRHGIDLRVFILVQPPFMKAEESLHWAQRSLDFAFDCGATAATLIPTRDGNGAMEALAEAGMFAAPELKLLEAAAAYGLRLRRGRVFTDLWEVKRGRECMRCFDARVQRLREMNLMQALTPVVRCDACGGKDQEAN
jgi:archaeosine synthase beta-subunit